MPDRTRNLAMNPIKRLRDELIKRFPGVDAQIDAPAYAMGLWQLDLRPSGGSPWIVVEWKPDTGFGVSTPGADDYGTKPDEPPDPRLARGGSLAVSSSSPATHGSSPAKILNLTYARALRASRLQGFWQK